MATTIKATYEGGVFKPKQPVSLPEHLDVDVVIPTESTDDDGWKAMREFIGLAGDDAGGGNVSEGHDAIIYRR